MLASRRQGSQPIPKIHRRNESKDILSARLKEMEKDGVATRSLKLCEPGGYGMEK